MAATSAMNQSCICNLNEAGLIAEIAQARRRITFVGPGISKPVAAALAGAWQRLGASAVSVILDVDPEVCRMGYGSLEGLDIIQAAAARLNEAVCHQPGVRICILVADGATLVFSPTPLLVESGTTRPDHPNALRFHVSPAEIERDLGISKEGQASRTVGLEPLSPGQLNGMRADLRDNPPVKFDLARKVRVFNSQLEFVEFELHGCFVSRKTVPIPPDLIGLAGDKATKERLRSTFKMLKETDSVAASPGGLSEMTLKEKRKRIADTYLRSLQGFGTVILRANKPAFEKEVGELQALVVEFQTKLRAKLRDIIDQNARNLADALFPAVKQSRPAHWKGDLGPSPTDSEIHTRLLTEIRKAFGSAETIVNEMSATVVFKGVTYETLTSPRFAELVQAQFPLLMLHEEYNAVREA